MICAIHGQVKLKGESQRASRQDLAKLTDGCWQLVADLLKTALMLHDSLAGSALEAEWACDLQLPQNGCTRVLQTTVSDVCLTCMLEILIWAESMSKEQCIVRYLLNDPI